MKQNLLEFQKLNLLEKRKNLLITFGLIPQAYFRKELVNQQLL